MKLERICLLALFTITYGLSVNKNNDRSEPTFHSIWTSSCLDSIGSRLTSPHSAVKMNFLAYSMRYFCHCNQFHSLNEQMSFYYNFYSSKISYLMNFYRSALMNCPGDSPWFWLNIQMSITLCTCTHKRN